MVCCLRVALEPTACHQSWLTLVPVHHTLLAKLMRMVMIISKLEVGCLAVLAVVRLLVALSQDHLFL